MNFDSSRYFGIVTVLESTLDYRPLKGRVQIPCLGSVFRAVLFLEQPPVILKHPWPGILKHLRSVRVVSRIRVADMEEPGQEERQDHLSSEGPCSPSAPNRVRFM